MASRSRLLRSTLALGAVSALALALLVSPGTRELASANEPTPLLSQDFEGSNFTVDQRLLPWQVAKLFESDFGEVGTCPECLVVKRSNDPEPAAVATSPEYGPVTLERDATTGNTYLVKVVREGAFADPQRLNTDRLSLRWMLDQPVNELYLQYDVKVGPSWTPGGDDAEGGGKLPGLCGGACPAGRGEVIGADGKSRGFSARTNFNYMENGTGGLSQYMYYVEKPDDLETGLNCVYRRPWALVAGEDPAKPGCAKGSGARPALSTSWQTITHRVKMNTVRSNGTGRPDGVMAAWVGTDKVYEDVTVHWRDSTDMKVDSMLFAHMFGGATEDKHAAPAGAKIMFDNIRVSTAAPAGIG